MCLIDVIETPRIYASLKLKLLCSSALSSQHSDLARRHARRRVFSLRHGMPAPESVVLETNLGNIQLELYWDHAPRVCLPSSISQSMTYSQVQRSLSGSLSQTCENFAQLAKRGYYNGVIFHRIVAVRLDESRLFRLLLIVSFKGFYGPGWRSDWDR